MALDRARLGRFFLMIGLVMLILFFGTDQSHDPQFLLFFGGALLTGWGVFLVWRGYKAPPPTNRFVAVRKLFQRGKNPPAPKEPKPKRSWFKSAKPKAKK